MLVGKVEFWVPGRSEGAIRDERHGRLRFTAGDLIGLDVGEIRQGMEVVYDVGPGGTATRVRPPRASFLSLPS